MSTPREPGGSAPQTPDRRVFIRRRLIVLAVFLAIVAVIVLIIVRPGSTGGAQDASQVSVPKDLAGADAPDDDETDDGEVPVCATGQLAVTPKTDKSDYAAGEEPQLSLTVENTGEAACSADLGSAELQFVVASGADEVWRSADCQKNPEHLAVILDPGKTIESEAIAWDRTRSSTETCDITRDAVSAEGASYHLRAAAGGVQGTGTAQFLLY